MTTPLYALVALIIIVIASKVPLAIAMHQSSRMGYDNRTPRQQQAALIGWGARALAAHQNTFEALIIFTAAVVVSHLASSPATAPMAATLAIVHTAARLLYLVLYLANFHLWRTIVWGCGFLCALWMALLPVIG